MSLPAHIRRTWYDSLSALQFLTRIRVPPVPYDANSLSRSAKFFPIVGLLVGAGAALLHFLLTPHLPTFVVALIILVYLVAVTGCFHEDGLADAIDGFGGGWDRSQVLEIMRDSRIGSYGAVALILSLLARWLLIGTTPTLYIGRYLIAAHVLCRWTTLPLSFYLPSAREQKAGEIDGQGARIARVTTLSTLVIGTLFTFVTVGTVLRMRSFAPVIVSTAVAVLTGLYYRHRINGVTGDCFGATNQLTEIAVYLCGVWA